MGKGQREGEVHVQVHDPPRLVLEVPPSPLDGADPSGDEETETNRRSQDVGVGGDKDPELVQSPDPCHLGVTQSDEHNVCGDEHEWPRPDTAMPTNEPVLPDGALEPGQARDEHDHDQHQVRAGKSRQATSGDEPTSGCVERTAGLARDDQGQYGAEAESGQSGTDVGHPGPGGRAGPSPRLTGDDHAAPQVHLRGLRHAIERRKPS